MKCYVKKAVKEAVTDTGHEGGDVTVGIGRKDR